MNMTANRAMVMREAKVGHNEVSTGGKAVL
jgi:hypothetical protein